MKELYNNLLKLTEEHGDCFFFRDHWSSIGNHFRVFSYHIAGLTQWMLPDALECRGIMFELINGEPYRIASRPMEKFFNLAERQAWNLTNSGVVGLDKLELDYSNIDRYEDKADGSLMSSYHFIDPEDDNRINYMLKSKTSINSDQANDANRWLVNHTDLLDFIIDCEEAGYTVNLEWCSPKNQIVIMYPEESLKILNVRHRDTGEYYSNNKLIRSPVFRKYAVDQFMFEEGTDVNAAISNMYNETGIEGYILVMKDGSRVKIKTTSYVARHKLKDSITNNKDLVIAVAQGVSDDLRQLFLDDSLSLTKIQEFEDHVVSVAGSTYTKIREAHKACAGMERREYAISMQNTFKQDRMFFNIVMKMFQAPDLEVMPEIMAVIIKYPEEFIPTKWG
ncbi:putative RNA ligase [Aeromonas phage P19]|uniref:RNA ligase 1 n=1 Tax=Aeromonas phage vB_AdhaM_G2 TaxID=3238786 RepID=A0AB39TZ78_9CAUD|nr:putative RNA ligase [Aeromonas phage P19]